MPAAASLSVQLRSLMSGTGSGSVSSYKTNSFKTGMKSVDVFLAIDPEMNCEKNITINKEIITSDICLNLNAQHFF